MYSDDEHAGSAARGREHHRPSSSNPVHVEEGRPGEDCVLGEGNRRQDERHLEREVEIVLEDVCEVVAYSV